MSALESSYDSGINETTNLLARMLTPRRRMRLHGRLWKVKSKGAILTLILNYFVSSTFFTLACLLSEMDSTDNTKVLFEIVVDKAHLLCLALLVVSCPVAGFLADVYFSRYKVLQCGLWFSWLGVLVINTNLLLSYNFESFQRFLGVPGGLVGGVLVTVGLSTYLVNALHFGIDQMPDASAEQVSAYIHWFAWGIFAGILTSRFSKPITYCLPSTYHSRSILIQLMVPMVMLSLVLCCICLLREWLIIEPECPNSLRTIYRVLKFAVTHKHPIRRRAITYTEDVKPSRIDFAKDKYGGPFTTEQVEDVKTFFRVVVVLTSMPALFAPIGWFIASLDFIISHGYCSLLKQQVSYLIPLFGVTIIPAYTFILYPLARNRIFSMLQRVVLAAVLTIILCGVILIVDSVRHAQDSDIVCMFTTSSYILNFNIWWTIPFNFVATVAVAFGSIVLVEFTCAQSPYSMRGLLIGILYSVGAFTFPLIYGTFAAWNNFPKQISPSCDFYYFLFQFLCAVIGLIVLCIVTRWYKRRRREEEDDQRRIVEAIYDRMLQNQT